MGGDVELCELVAVEWEREERGNHLGTNHRVREPWKGCSEIDDKEGQMFSAFSYMDLQIGSIDEQHHKQTPKDCPTSIFYWL